MPFGLVSSEQIDDYWSQNTRRKIFYAYPNGTAPLTGLLSMSESEDTPQPVFGWNEERWAETASATKTNPTGGANKDGPFTTSGGVTPAGDANGKFTVAQWGAIRVYVVDGTKFQTNDVVKVFSVGVTTGAGPATTGTQDLVGRVVSIGADFLELLAVTAWTGVENTAATSNGKMAVLIGSAYAEGARSQSGGIVFPYEITNNTQIFKTPYELTRTALKEPLKYDKTGAYKDQSKNNGIKHLASIERAAFFGENAKTTEVDPDTGQTVPRRYTGGLRWFLDQWEKGTLYGQPDVSAVADWRTAPNKRVIKCGGTTITKGDFNLLMARVFERTNNTSWDKLCLCGPEYLAKISDMFERQCQFTSLRDEGFDGFNFKVVRHLSNSGEVYYKQHPLFTSTEMRNSAFYLDLGYIGYRPLSDSDTDIQPMIQLPDADKRKDQWLTECGFEFRFPEANMYVEALGGITLT
jgi:hypothetical protein